METPPGPLVIANDPTLLSSVARACAAAGVVPAAGSDPSAALVAASRAPVLLVGAECVEALAGLALPAPVRPGSVRAVYVLARSEPAPDVLRSALACGALGVLELPAQESRLVDLLTDAADGLGALGLVVGILGGSGGAGASTFATALGETLARASPTLVVDADRAGGGIDQILALDPATGVRWDALRQASGRLSARSLRETLPTRGGLSVLGWPADPAERAQGLEVDTVRSVLSAGRRGYPVVLVDLPRADPVALAELVPRCDQLIVVCTTTVPGISASARLTAAVAGPPCAVVLRGRRGYDVEQVSRVLGAPVWHRMPDQRGLDEAVSLGLGALRSRRGPLARAAGRVAGKLLGPRR